LGAALRYIPGPTVRDRPRHRQRPRRAPVFRPIKPDPPRRKSSRGRWLLVRLLLTVALSVLIHGVIWFFSPNPRAPESGKSRGVLPFEIPTKGTSNRKKAPVVKKAPPVIHKNAAPSIQPKAVDTPHPIEAPVDKPHPVEAPSGSVAPAQPVGPAGPLGPHGGKAGPVMNGDGKPVDFFAPAALGAAEKAFAQSIPDREQFISAGAMGAGHDATADAALINGRLLGDIDQANAEGRVGGGLVSACNDGHDNNYDGLIDCADLGCRQMPGCLGTEEFTYHHPQTIPDDDTRGLVTHLAINDGNENAIRALSISVYLTHGSPGDLSIDVTHDGETKRVLYADPATHYFPIAFYLEEFIGKGSQGTWTVTIRDVYPGTTGKLDHWTLFMTR